MISDRPAEADDRAVPGRWEGDLIIGKNSGSAIGTLRRTQHPLRDASPPAHLPTDHTAASVRDAVTEAAHRLPPHFKRWLGPGFEMAAHHSFTIATDVPVLRPGKPLAARLRRAAAAVLPQGNRPIRPQPHSREHLYTVAAQLNGRPRKTLGWETPAERLHKLLAV